MGYKPPHPLRRFFRGTEIDFVFFEKGVDFLGKVRYNLFLHKGHSMPGRIFEQEV